MTGSLRKRDKAGYTSDMLVDSHVHLTDYPTGVDPVEVARQSRQAGVSLLVNNATSQRDWRAVVALAQRLPAIVPCVGLHPWFVESRSPGWLDELRELARPSWVGIGEIGLHKLAREADMQAQEEVFVAQLELARELGRPAMVHCVSAWGRLAVLIREHRPPAEGFLLHAYGGSAEMVGSLADAGAWFSFSATVLNPQRRRAPEALRAVPRDRLLVETDAPNMLPPEPYRRHSLRSGGDELNTPANLPAVVEGIAAILGEQVGVLLDALEHNSRQFLGPLLRERAPA